MNGVFFRQGSVVGRYSRDRMGGGNLIHIAIDEYYRLSPLEERARKTGKAKEKEKENKEKNGGGGEKRFEKIKKFP